MFRDLYKGIPAPAEDAQAAKAQAQAANAVAAKARADQCKVEAVQEGPLDSLRRRWMMQTHESQNIEKALMILERHPEFSEFLWLLRSGLV